MAMVIPGSCSEYEINMVAQDLNPPGKKVTNKKCRITP